MRLPVIRGIIDRRILVNYRVDPEVLAGVLPEPFRPQVVGGFGMAGICLIRLGEVRPRGLPRWMGMGSENAAHRVAVEWDEGNEVRQGVYVLRRDTDSRLNALAGGRVFPGVHHHGCFRVRESERRFEVAVESDDGEVSISVTAELADEWAGGSVFGSLGEASAFYEAGAVGYSPAGEVGRFQGLELRCENWAVRPLEVESVRSSLFDDEAVFPRGSVSFDCALLMRGVEHEWWGRGRTSAAVSISQQHWRRTKK